MHLYLPLVVVVDLASLDVRVGEEGSKHLLFGLILMCDLFDECFAHRFFDGVDSPLVQDVCASLRLVWMEFKGL